MGGVSPASADLSRGRPGPEREPEVPDHESEFANEALERLEWADAQAGGDAALAAAGGHAAHGADRRRRRASRRRSSPRAAAAARPSKHDGAERTASSGTPASGIFESTRQAQVRLRQPRDDEPVLRADASTAPRTRASCSAARYQWTGSENSNVNEMVNAFNTAITGGADGIAVALVDEQGVQRADRRGAEGEDPGRRLQRRRDEQRAPVLHRPGPVRLRPGDGQAHRRPRAVGRRGAVHRDAGLRRTSSRASTARRTALKSHSAIKPHVIATGAALPAELSVIDSYATGHPDTKGYFAVDAGSTQGLAQTIQKHNLRSKGVKGGGYDLTPITQKLLADDQIDFTIDQQPYLQGFLPVLQLYLYKVSQRAVGHRRRQHRPEVPRQDDGRPLQQHQEPLRGHLVLARRDRGVAQANGRMSDVRTASEAPARAARRRAPPEPPAPAGPAARRARAALPDAARGQHHRRHGPRGDLLRA